MSRRARRSGLLRRYAPRNDEQEPSLRAEGEAIQGPQATDRFHGIAPLGVEERAEQRWPPFLEVAFPLESALQQNLDSLLRFRPRQRCLKGIEGVEEPVGGW